MIFFDSLDNKELIELININKIGVIPTDTIYGVIGSAMSPRVVERIYDLKNREESKPMIVLAASEKQIRKTFNVSIPDKIAEDWPEKTSVVISTEDFSHLHRGKKSIAFRVPQKEELKYLLKKAGPVVAPSANPEGRESAKTVIEAKNYFGDRVDFYVDEGELNSSPSTLVKVKEDNTFEILRKGATDPESIL